MKSILGMGNALTDILALLPDESLLEKFHLPHGSMQHVDAKTADTIWRDLKPLGVQYVAGGSAANTITGTAVLGMPSGFVGKVGDDELGSLFYADQHRNGIKSCLLKGEHASGRAMVFVTGPDADRTFAVYLGAALELGPDDLIPEMFHGYDYFHIEGYLVQNQHLVRRAVKLAREEGMIISLDMASYNVVGTVILERTFDMICLVVITIAVAFLRMEVFGEFLVRQVWTPLTHWFDGSAVWVISLLAALIILPILLWIVFRKKLKKYKAVTKITGFFKGMWDGLIESFKMPHKGMFFFLTALMWFLYVCTSYCTILATPLRDTLTFTDALFLMVVGSFGWVVPVQGGFGAFHFIVTLALVAVYGLSHTNGMVFATISHEAQAVTMLLTGLFAVIYMSVSKKSVKTH
jgi:hypothetical protein